MCSLPSLPGLREQPISLSSPNPLALWTENVKPREGKSLPTVPSRLEAALPRLSWVYKPRPRGPADPDLSPSSDT